MDNGQTPGGNTTTAGAVEMARSPDIGTLKPDDAVERSVAAYRAVHAPESAQATQADRDAAADIYRRFDYGNDRLQDKLLAAFMDHDPIVQAFARHRQTHSLPGDVGIKQAAQRALSILERNLHRQTEKCDDAVSILRAALTPSALSEADAVTVLADHPLAKGLRTSQKALDEIARQEQANIAGYLALRDFPIGSALSGDAGEGWQPIETAPKDGRNILVIGLPPLWKNYPFVVFWDAAAEDGEGWWRHTDPSLDSLYAVSDSITHWAEYPDPAALPSHQGAE